ncbi:MAG: ABC transporter permease [Bacteroidota bacterium]
MKEEEIPVAGDNSVSWDQVISPRRSLFDLHLKEIWRYRDLLKMLVRRDFVTIYKQTILGPLWLFIQPVFTAIIYMVIFARVANISTEGIPPVLFYLGGISIWNYFGICFSRTSGTFDANKHIFGKVYFPRLVSPLSVVIVELFKFLIQFLLFIAVLVFYLVKGAEIHVNAYALLTPLLLVLMAGIGMGFGMIVSSLTTKYRDLQFLMGFIIQLWMYATPIIYPISFVPEPYRDYLKWNPIAPIVETYKYGFFGTGTFSWDGLLYSAVFMILLLFLGVLVFNRTEKSFMDTI